MTVPTENPKNGLSVSQGEETWVTNGIGVSGDSGAWILEGGTDNIVQNVNTGSSTAFMLAVGENADDCNLCVNLKICRCLKICRLGTLMRPATRKNICGICHETVNEKLSENVRSAPRHSPRLGMMVGTGDWGWRTASIEAATENINSLMADINALRDDRDCKRATLC